jgi:hypothetical protein
VTDFGAAGADFGDVEPEDSWHPDDPPPECCANLLRRLALVDPDGESLVLLRILDGISERVRFTRMQRNLSDADVARLDGIDEDVAFLRGRL